MQGKNVYDVDGKLVVVLAQIQNVYPVEEDEGIYCWGFKYLSQVFEFFYYRTKAKADRSREDFVKALDECKAVQENGRGIHGE